jgi:Zn-dependent protease with chaperone function
MPGGKWADLAAQSLAHAFVAAIATEALLRAWGARRASDRLVLRLAALGQPLVVTPLLFLLFPGRAGDAFHDRYALLVARRFEEVRFVGTDAFHAGLLLASALGLALFLMDVVPLVRARRRPDALSVTAPEGLLRAWTCSISPSSSPSPRLRGEGRGEGSSREPRLRFIPIASPALFCAGIRRTEVVVSRGALDLLDAEELAAALAHERAHLASRDPALSWALMAVRALLFFNPVVHVVARTITRDAERRADAALGGARERVVLASALVKLHRAAGEPPPQARRSLPLAAALAGPLRRGRAHEVAGRCRLLLADPLPPLAWRGARVALAAISLAALAVLVA